MSDNRFDSLLRELAALVRERKGGDPEQSYTARLYAGGEDRILQKLGEEVTELLLASKSGDRNAILHESADLLYHVLVLLGWHELSLQDVLEVLQKRQGQSGLEEKAGRTESP